MAGLKYAYDKLCGCVCTTILLGSPNLGMPRCRNSDLLAPILRHSWSWAKVGGSSSLLGASLGGDGGSWPGCIVLLYVTIIIRNNVQY